MWWQEILPSFSLKLVSIFADISRSIEPIALNRVSLERSPPPVELSIDDANFGQR